MAPSSRYVPGGTAQAVQAGQDATSKLIASLPPFRKDHSRGPAIYSTPSGKRITASQEAFCRLVAAGWSIGDAWRHCYATTTAKPSTIQRRAWALANTNPATNSRIRELIDARMAGQMHQASYLRAHVIEHLFSESKDLANKPSDRIRALELLGRVGTVGLFETPREEQQAADDSLEGLRDRLKARLTTLLGAGMLDITPETAISGNNSYAIKPEETAAAQGDLAPEGAPDTPLGDPHPPGEAPLAGSGSPQPRPNTTDLTPPPATPETPPEDPL
jgi:hypothetical protein